MIIMGRNRGMRKTGWLLCHGNNECIYYINRRRKGNYSVPVLFFPNPPVLLFLVQILKRWQPVMMLSISLNAWDVREYTWLPNILLLKVNQRFLSKLVFYFIKPRRIPFLKVCMYFDTINLQTGIKVPFSFQFSIIRKLSDSFMCVSRISGRQWVSDRETLSDSSLKGKSMCTE